MAPILASFVCVVGIVALFLLEREPGTKSSPALWLVIAWISIGSSRMVSQWLGSPTTMQTPDQYLDGSPLDRFILTGLLICALVVLARRKAKVIAFIRANPALIVFLGFCAISAAWSDYPLVAVKRWTKALGNVAMVLIIWTDPQRATAIRRAFAWTAFLLIPLSILLIKYYPDLGRGYDRWLGTAYYTGVATEKNSLGCICVILGLASVWRSIEAWTEKPRRVRPILVHGIILGMVVWLLWMANSATSVACFLIGSAVMCLVSLLRTRQPRTVHAVLGAAVVVGLLSYVFLDADTYSIQALGRDTTLTGRTELWDELWRMDSSPWLGAGFESFFLGPRAEYLWNKYWWHPNQAHNGYLEVYLNLGRVGIVLLVFLFASAYRNAVRALNTPQDAGTLRLAFIAAAIFYNLSEAAFKVMHPMWIAFLWAAVVAPDMPPANDLSASSSPERPALERRRPPAEWPRRRAAVSAPPGAAGPQPRLRRHSVTVS